jgi:hypothetical protein
MQKEKGGSWGGTLCKALVMLGDTKEGASMVKGLCD